MLKKGQDYEIKIADNIICKHTLQIKVDISGQKATVESGYLVEFNNMANMTWNDKKNVTFSKNEYYTYSYNRNSTFIIKITPKSDCTLTYFLYRHTDVKDNINMTSSSSSSYRWSASYQPGGTAAVTNIRLFLTKADARKIGKILKSESVVNCINSFSDSSSKEWKTSELNKALTMATKNNPTDKVEIISGAILGLIQYGINYSNLSTQIKKAGEILCSATAPMCLDFDEGVSPNYLTDVSAFSMRAMKNTATGRYALMAPVGHEGKFEKVDF